MVQTTARIKQRGKNFEIIIDIDKALRFKKGESSSIDFLEIDEIFSDSKKGLVPSKKDLEEAFGTTDINSIAGKIVKSGEILLKKEYRDEEREKKIKQIVDILASNAIDPKTGHPHTPDRIKNALESAHINIKNTPIENQMKEIIAELSKIIPLKIEEKRFEITIPSIYTGQAYGIVNPYKENEKWLDNGDLRVNVHVPSGIVFSFFDKLNSITHGSATTEEIREQE